MQLILKFSNFKFQQGSFTACVILCGCQLSSSDHSLSSFFNISVLSKWKEDLFSCWVRCDKAMMWYSPDMNLVPITWGPYQAGIGMKLVVQKPKKSGIESTTITCFIWQPCSHYTKNHHNNTLLGCVASTHTWNACPHKVAIIKTTWFCLNL